MTRKEELIQRYPQLESCLPDIEKCVDALVTSYKNGGKLLICGNGGSSSDSGHIVGELMKGFLKKRPISKEQRAVMSSRCEALDDEFFDRLQGSLPAINLTENSTLISAFANDVDPLMSYAQQVLGLGQPQDVFLGISTSGNAENVANALKVASGLGLTTLSLTGKDGGKLKKLSNITVVVPESETFKIQELHLPVYHYICAAVEEAFFKA